MPDVIGLTGAVSDRQFDKLGEVSDGVIQTRRYNTYMDRFDGQEWNFERNNRFEGGLIEDNGSDNVLPVVIPNGAFTYTMFYSINSWTPFRNNFTPARLIYQPLNADKRLVDLVNSLEDATELMALDANGVRKLNLSKMLFFFPPYAKETFPINVGFFTPLLIGSHRSVRLDTVDAQLRYWGIYREFFEGAFIPYGWNRKIYGDYGSGGQRQISTYCASMLAFSPTDALGNNTQLTWIRNTLFNIKAYDADDKLLCTIPMQVLRLPGEGTVPAVYGYRLVDDGPGPDGFYRSLVYQPYMIEAIATSKPILTEHLVNSLNTLTFTQLTNLVSYIEVESHVVPGSLLFPLFYQQDGADADRLSDIDAEGRVTQAVSRTVTVRYDSRIRAGLFFVVDDRTDSFIIKNVEVLGRNKFMRLGLESDA